MSGLWRDSHKLIAVRWEKVPGVQKFQFFRRASNPYEFKVFKVRSCFLKYCMVNNVHAKQNLSGGLTGLPGCQFPTSGLNEVTGFNTRDGQIY